MQRNNAMALLLIFLSNPSKGIDKVKTAFQKAGWYSQVEETFFKQQYYELYKNIVPHTIVLDLGAFIGDTAIYFAMNNNVDKVVAFEPNPITFKRMERNVRLSGLKNKIEMRNQAISRCQEGDYVINRDNYESIANQTITADEGDIKAVKLQTILKKYAGRRIAIKADIEGAEKDIFDAADMRDVYSVVLECHNCKRKVDEVLTKKGFRVHDANPDMVEGIMYARK